MYYRTLQQFIDENGYWIGKTWMPRVTRIVEMKRKPGLEQFYKERTAEEAARIASASAGEGTRIHNAVEHILVGEEPEVDEVIAPVIAAFRDFLGAHSLITRQEWIEHRVVSFDYRYAGTTDLLIEIDGVFALLDIKTGTAVYRDYGIQTSAYVNAINESGGVFDVTTGEKTEITRAIETRYILLLNKKQICERCGAEKNIKGEREKVYGGDRSCSHAFGPTRGFATLAPNADLSEDFRAFVACRDLWEWENKEWLQQLGY